MAKNIFLTGNLHVGKTTLINQIIAALPATRISGFRTSRYYHDQKLKGFYIEDINIKSKEFKDKFIGKCIDEDHWVSIPSTFDGYGTKIMERCLNDQADLIVMDELGFLKMTQPGSKQRFSGLDADKPVLGVLKQRIRLSSGRSATGKMSLSMKFAKTTGSDYYRSFYASCKMRLVKERTG